MPTTMPCSESVLRSRQPEKDHSAHPSGQPIHMCSVRNGQNPKAECYVQVCVCVNVVDGWFVCDRWFWCSARPSFVIGSGAYFEASRVSAYVPARQHPPGVCLYCAFGAHELPAGTSSTSTTESYTGGIGSSNRQGEAIALYREVLREQY